MKATLRLFCFAVLFMLVCQLAFAQSAATGDLYVVVKDPKGFEHCIRLALTGPPA